MSKVIIGILGFAAICAVMFGATNMKSRVTHVIDSWTRSIKSIESIGKGGPSGHSQPGSLGDSIRSERAAVAAATREATEGDDSDGQGYGNGSATQASQFGATSAAY